MRKIKTTKQEINLLEPVILSDIISPDDCFGLEYDPRSNDCSICADLELCGIKYQTVVQKKKKEFEDQNGPMLDEVDFKAVDWKKIEIKALEYEELGEPMKFEELMEAIMIIAKIKDSTAAAEYIKRSLPNTNLILENGKVLCQKVK